MPHRHSLLSLLENYIPLNREEQFSKDMIINFVKNNKDCFLRSNMAGHITASCWLLSPNSEEILLTHHKKIGLWLQLGGHADGDHDVRRVALMEAREESGIEGIVMVDDGIFDAEVHAIAEHQGVPAHLHYDVRFLMRAPHKEFAVSEESHNLAWVPIERLADGIDFTESLKRMAKKTGSY